VVDQLDAVSRRLERRGQRGGSPRHTVGWKIDVARFKESLCTAPA
jgi:hypothetical protein